MEEGEFKPNSGKCTSVGGFEIKLHDLKHALLVLWTNFVHMTNLIFWIESALMDGIFCVLIKIKLISNNHYVQVFNLWKTSDQMWITQYFSLRKKIFFINIFFSYNICGTSEVAFICVIKMGNCV